MSEKYFLLRCKLRRSNSSKLVFSLLAKLSRSCSGKTLRRSEQPVSQIPFKGGWGRCPNKQFAKIDPKGKIEKMSEPVQVYTACQFVKGQNTAPIYFQLGNNSTMPPVANSSTSRNTLFPYLNLCPTWVQVKLRVLTIGPVPKSGTGQRTGTVLLAKLARSNFVPVWREVRTNN